MVNSNYEYQVTICYTTNYFAANLNDGTPEKDIMYSLICYTLDRLGFNTIVLFMLKLYALCEGI